MRAKRSVIESTSTWVIRSSSSKRWPVKTPNTKRTSKTCLTSLTRSRSCKTRKCRKRLECHLSYNYTFLFSNSLDNQFAYSQNLELKFRELNQTNAFEKLVNKKEIESLKNKLTVSQESLDKLGSYFQALPQNKSVLVGDMNVFAEGKSGGEENIQSGEQVRAFRHSPADLNRSCSMQDLFSDPKHVQVGKLLL